MKFLNLQSKHLPALGPIERVLPRSIVHDLVLADQDIREGRFQRSLSLITAFSALLSGLEVAYEHYRSGFGLQVMYSPVILSPLLVIAGAWGALSRRVARTVLPIVSLLTLADGIAGVYFHVRGIARKPGGWRLPVVNIVMGPPLLAPLLFGVSGYLGLIASLLRQEGSPSRPTLPGVPPPEPVWLRWLPRRLSHEGVVFEHEVREGRFQRHLAVAAALTTLFSGFEALYSHYTNAFTYRMEWTPIVLAPIMGLAGLGTIWSRTIARTLLPLTSALLLLDGGIGLYYHVRGVLRRPGGFALGLYNIIYGPPVFAPLLLAAGGFMGMLASLLRRPA